MSEMYKVGIEIAMTGNATAAFDALIGKAIGLRGHVDGITEKLKSWNGLIVGGLAAFAGSKIVGGLFDLSKDGMDIEHWKAQLVAAGNTAQDVADATAAAWKNAGINMNTTAADNLKNIIEINKATGNLRESMELMPAFNVVQAVSQSVKAEGMDSTFKDGTQNLNFARGLEELGVTQMGATEEERRANIEKYAHEYIKTMIASRGLFDGNSLFAMTNNSAGAVQTWDMRMATVIGPIIGNIMKASKLGNADYMSLKSFQGGKITSDTVEGLRKWHLAGDDDTYQDGKGKWHLKANSGFAAGMETNLWDWSAKKLAQLTASGVDINDPKQMNAMINEIGGNKSNSMLLRMLFNPNARAQIAKEIGLRDMVPDSAAGSLMGNDPLLQMDAFNKKWRDLTTALGAPLVGTATMMIGGLTTAVSALASAAAGHPDAARNIELFAGAMGVALTAFGGFKMGKGVVDLFGKGGLFGSATALNTSAVMLQEAAVALGAKGVPGVGGTAGAAGAGIIGRMFKLGGWAAALAGLLEAANDYGHWRTDGITVPPEEIKRRQNVGGIAGHAGAGTGVAPSTDPRLLRAGAASPPPTVNVAPPNVQTQVNVTIDGQQLRAIVTQIVKSAIGSMGGFSTGSPTPNTGTMPPAVDGATGN